MRVFVIALVVALSACDSHNGVVRVIHVKHSIPHQCVNKALENINPDITVKYTLSENKPDFQRHFYDYKYNDLKVRLGILQNTSGVTFTHLYMRTNKTPSQKNIDRVRPLMVEVEKSIGVACNLSGTDNKAKEECRGVICPQI